MNDYFEPEKEIAADSTTTYRGSNTVSEYYKRQRNIFLVSAFFIDVTAIIVAVITVKRGITSEFDLFLRAMEAVIPLMMTGMVIYTWIQYKHYSTVELTNVQKVVPKTSSVFMAWTYRLKITVRIKGVKEKKYTHLIFDSPGLPLVNYVDKPHRAGYDPVRKRWVII